ncbi:MAG: Transcription elongation factor spt6 [Caeruleum heppii]|nr:MAG: Transcription elongation factor spt6 [Caeruleum heppii]KAI9673689.1 MAG: Transcription elongation factor spt6 [Caeruleum heppii]
MSANDFIVGEAEIDDEENEDSVDEETGEVKERANGVTGGVDDSSDEDESDEDEEAERAVREGFIVDEDEEPAERERRKRGDKKRRREERERVEEVLDEEDLDLIGEAHPDLQPRAPSEPQFKRLKRGHREDGERNGPRGLDEIFSDDDDEQDAPNQVDEDRLGRFRPEPRGGLDEFADFIEEDEPIDEDERNRLQEERETARPRGQGFEIAGAQVSGLDKDTLEMMQEAFGDGTDYEWALAIEDELEEQELTAQTLELKDVFEPTQLSERLMTDEDNQIRWADEPERFQIARAPLKHIVLTDEQIREEALWISRMMPKRSRMPEDLIDPFQKSVAKALEFFVAEDVEVPFIFQHRKDYLIHAVKEAVTPDPHNPERPKFTVNAEKLLNQDDLWNVFEYDLKFRALVDKRSALQRTYDNLHSVASVQDEVFEEMLPAAETMEELQDIQDYIYFQHASHLKDLSVLNGDANGTHRRPGSQKSLFERIRNGPIYNMVRAFGLTADEFAQNALKEGRRRYAEDPSVRPDDMADSDTILDPPEFATGAQVQRAAKMMFAEEIALSPKMRKVMRRQYYMTGVIECFRTEKGLKRIDEQHPYYEFKYLRNQQLSDIARRPDMYLRMLKAEEEGLIEVKIRLHGYEDFKRRLLQDIASDNYSEIAEAWNAERKEVLDMALTKLNSFMNKSVKENLKSRCEDEIVALCRSEFSKKLDQAPFKPQGMLIGTVPRVLALSCGAGQPGRDAVCWAWVEESGRVLENGKWTDLRFDEKAKDDFVELVQRRKPDVIGVSGFTVETRKLIVDVEKLVDERDLRCAEYEDEETGDYISGKLDVVAVNDEVARLYQTSTRATLEHPGFAPLTRYCVALAKYLQNPMKEYAALGKDIVSIAFHPAQQLVASEKVLKSLETALVDMVNLCGVDINEAVSDPYTANLLPYVCGLGPRKATSVLKAIHTNGGVVTTRDELVGDPEQGKLQVVGPRVWNNCASFLCIEYDSSEPTSDFLDNTRIHPEDYEIARKMAADALELDEEDIRAETDEGGPAAVVKRLVKEEAADKVNDLVLEEYADNLLLTFNQRKRATLETIRAELQQPYEELRRNLALLSTDEIFTMLTGETRDSLCTGMIVPVSIKRVLNMEHQLDVQLDSGVKGIIMENEISDRIEDVSLGQLFSVHQTLQAKILHLSRSAMEATLTIREEVLRKPYRRELDHMRDEWDEQQEERDKEMLQVKDKESGRAQRVIKHPLFRNFNSAQAEEYLGSQARGDVVIRPSSKGLDHIAVTWKVSDNVYQHIDVLELDKENEFSVGRILKIGRRYTYSDLDELVVNHVKAMAKKVDEMTGHEKFQRGTKAETERWLTTYTEANPKRSVYAFCINPKYPGYFHLCFKAGQHAKLGSWPVKVVPLAFELQNNPYPDMRALCNGFKLLFQNMQGGGRR